MFYVAVVTINFLSEELAVRHKTFADSTRVLMLSERVIKKELAKVNGPLILANVIDDSANLHSVAEELKNYYHTPIIIKIFTRYETKEVRAGRTDELVCVRRFVIFKGDIAYVEVCA